MKRFGYLYESICSTNNLRLADKKARKGKSRQHGVKLFDRNPEQNILNLHEVLVNQRYQTSRYTVFTIYEGKEREIFRLPYYPDRIVHHAIMNVLEPIFVSGFVKNTYSCIKKRGVHKCARDLRVSLRDVEATRYCLKLDIQKFYPNIDHSILKKLLLRKFKDQKLLNLLGEIIDSPGEKGVPIGNYLSQFLANFYLSGFDHWLKEDRKVQHYFRYCDDLVILGSDKNQLRKLFHKIEEYLNVNLNLKIKANYQIFPVASRGIDFLGYRFFHTHVLLRDSIKKKFINMIRHYNNYRSRVAYNGWLVHCDSINLRRKYLHEERRGIHKGNDIILR